MFQKHISVKYFKQTNNERQGQKKKRYSYTCRFHNLSFNIILSVAQKGNNFYCIIFSYNALNTTFSCAYINMYQCMSLKRLLQLHNVCIVLKNFNVNIEVFVYIILLSEGFIQISYSKPIQKLWKYVISEFYKIRQFTKRAHCLFMVNRVAVIHNKVATVSNKFLQSHLIN